MKTPLIIIRYFSGILTTKQLVLAPFFFFLARIQNKIPNNNRMINSKIDGCGFINGGRI